MAAELLRRRVLVCGVTIGVVTAVGLPSCHPFVTGLIAVPIGLLAGSALFAALAGVPRLPGMRRSLPVRLAYLAAGAALEEVLWRGFLLAALMPSLGRAAALGISAVGFAAAHVGALGRQAAVHLLTGTGFGGAFLIAGLPAAIAAHAVYNTLVDLGVESVAERAR
jgi:membrane protease YdiL (CAAX protease family)